MNKGLEALKDINYICDRIDFHRKHFLGNVDEDWIEKRIKQKSSIIEKELKEYEEIKAYMQQYEIENIEESRRVLHNDWVARQKFKTDNANIIKALEIIKNKDVLIANLKSTSNLKEYNKWIANYRVLTQEEYDLLKEILL